MSFSSGNGDSGNAIGRVLDVVGVGFGPSNLGLAIAIEEHNHERGPNPAIAAEFIEAKPEFGWHTGMLIPGTTMQISFLKDLASQRNVRSRYTFLSYLTDRGRLSDFINHQTFFPTRLEFHDYLEWAAARVAATVHYGTRAVAVRDEGDWLAIDVVRDGQSSTLRARAVGAASGVGVLPGADHGGVGPGVGPEARGGGGGGRRRVGRPGGPRGWRGGSLGGGGSGAAGPPRRSVGSRPRGR